MVKTLQRMERETALSKGKGKKTKSIIDWKEVSCNSILLFIWIVIFVWFFVKQMFVHLLDIQAGCILFSSGNSL